MQLTIYFKPYFWITTLTILCCSNYIYAQLNLENPILSVSQALQDKDKNGELDYIDQDIRVEGRVTVGYQTLNDQYISIYIQDDSSGIQIFSGSSDLKIEAGDSVIVSGRLQRYFDKPEIRAEAFEIVDVPSVEPTPVAIAKVASNPDSFLGMLAEGMAVVTQKRVSTGYRGITVLTSDSADYMLEVYIPQAHAYRDEFNLDILSVGDKINIKGIVGKFTFESTGRVVYQIIPRTPSDIQTTGIPQQYFTILFWISGLIALLVVGWIFSLSKQVKSKTSELSKALEEKEILMQEIHHRVKNNLAKISGLLDLQISTADHPAVEQSLSNSKSRINSMALIHDKLYQTQRYKTVQLDNYLQELVTTIHTSYNIKEDSVVLTFDCDPVELSVDKAVVCGLLVNELIVNAYKYAFDGHNKAQLKVSLKSSNEGFKLSISDNGPGLPQDFDDLVGKGLGTILIKNFAEQLSADMQVRSNVEGTTFTFEFK